MRFGSLCSGIEAASVAWHPLGWKAAWFSEIEKFPCAVLKHHYPNVPNLGDMTAPDLVDRARALGPIDLIASGTPCQSFSVAGLRGGLKDARGNLTLRFMEVVHALRPTHIFWENVPGVLNHKHNPFGCLLGGLAGHDAPLLPPIPEQGWHNAGVVSGPVYSLAWRVLDSQYFNVPQRRKRVYLVGYLGDWRCPAKILFEPQGLLRDTEAGEEKREITGSLSARTKSGGGSGTDFDLDGGLQISKAMNGKAGSRMDAESDTFIVHALKGDGFDASEDGTGRGVPLVLQPCGTDNAIMEDKTGALKANCDRASASAPVIFQQNQRDEVRTMDKAGALSGNAGMKQQNYVAFTQGNLARGEGPRPSDSVFPTLQKDAGDQHPCINSGMSVRRLMPVECERLQAFRDNYTNVPHRGKPSADGPRYKAIGNSWTTTVPTWIGRRIQMVEDLDK